jgi:hypothetical protein
MITHDLTAPMTCHCAITAATEIGSRRRNGCCHNSNTRPIKHQHLHSSLEQHNNAIMTEATKNEPQENDVLLGRGGGTNNHSGNVAFRSIVARHQAEYLQAKKKDKVTIARRIVGLVHKNGGKFLRKNTTSGEWEEVAEKKATEKTSQALREGLDVRRKVGSDKKKSPRRNSESSAEEPSTKRQKVANSVSWDESVPSLKEYDAGESTTLPDLQDEVLNMFHNSPSVSKEECDYVASV